MTKRKIIQTNRKWHRYLGIILGIQFLLWTLGGLYFSWTNIDEIRGDHIKQKDPLISAKRPLVSPSIFLDKLDSQDSIVSMQLCTILERSTYRLIVQNNGNNSVMLFDAENGSHRTPLDKEESIAVAKAKLIAPVSVVEVEYLTETGKHHEYRGRPLPAYAITFDAPVNTTAYVSVEHGNVQTLRSNKWRAFDFLWMLHTMDYQGRDNFNNLLLRAFALFGLFTILSGFSLFIFTSKTFSKKAIK